MSLIFWLLLHAWKILLLAAGIISVAVAAVSFLAVLEIKLLMCGLCHDFYMFPFRFFMRKKRQVMQNFVDTACAKTNYPNKLKVKIYFFPGLLSRLSFAFCICNAKTIFVQNWLLQRASDDFLAFVLCHEMGHIVMETYKIHADEIAGEYEADSFAASILGTDAAIECLRRTKDLIKTKHTKKRSFDSLMAATFQLDSRIRHLKYQKT